MKDFDTDDYRPPPTAAFTVLMHSRPVIPNLLTNRNLISIPNLLHLLIHNPPLSNPRRPPKDHFTSLEIIPLRVFLTKNLEIKLPPPRLQKLATHGILLLLRFQTLLPNSLLGILGQRFENLSLFVSEGGEVAFDWTYVPLSQGQFVYESVVCFDGADFAQIVEGVEGAAPVWLGGGAF